MLLICPVPSDKCGKLEVFSILLVHCVFTSMLSYRLCAWLWTAQCFVPLESLQANVTSFGALYS
jgi:hypothetical protein